MVFTFYTLSPITSQYTKLISIPKIQRLLKQCGEHLSLSLPALLMWDILSSILIFCFCTYTDKKLVLSFTLSGKHIQGRPITMIVSTNTLISSFSYNIHFYHVTFDIYPFISFISYSSTYHLIYYLSNGSYYISYSMHVIVVYIYYFHGYILYHLLRSIFMYCSHVLFMYCVHILVSCYTFHITFSFMYCTCSYTFRVLSYTFLYDLVSSYTLHLYFHYDYRSGIHDRFEREPHPVCHSVAM